MSSVLVALFFLSPSPVCSWLCVVWPGGPCYFYGARAQLFGPGTCGSNVVPIGIGPRGVNNATTTARRTLGHATGTRDPLRGCSPTAVLFLDPFANEGRVEKKDVKQGFRGAVRHCPVLPKKSRSETASTARPAIKPDVDVAKLAAKRLAPMPRTRRPGPLKKRRVKRQTDTVRAHRSAPQTGGRSRRRAAQRSEADTAQHETRPASFPAAGLGSCAP